MFNMTSIGRTIARLRREIDMTQVALADQMGVSCQAVSLWETGKSMPDIAKLPDLARLFGVTVDELLGASVPAVSHAIEGDLPARAADGTVTARELADAAPILPPSQIGQAVQQLANLTNLSDLLPYLDTDLIDEFLQEQAQKGQDIGMFLPFASDAVIDRILLEKARDGHEFADLLPFASDGAISQAALLSLQRGDHIDSLLPFLPDDFLNDLARAAFRNP